MKQYCTCEVCRIVGPLPRKQEGKRMIVSIDGIIGVGKSSLLEALQERGESVFQEPFMKNPILPRFYENPPRYAAMTQAVFFPLRVDMQMAIPARGVHFIERSALSDRNCVTPDTLILTEKGFVEISKMFVGDAVYTHTGNIHKITKIFNREIQESILKIRARKLLPLFITKEHPVLAIKTELCHINDNKGGYCYRNCRLHRKNNSLNCKKLYENYKIEWIKAGELKKGDFFVIPKEMAMEYDTMLDISTAKNDNSNMKQPDSDSILKSMDLGKFIGLLMAEGTRTKACVYFSLGMEESELKKNLDIISKKLWDIEIKTYGDNPGGTRLSLNSTFLGNLFKNLSSQPFRNIDKSMFSGNKNYWKGILNGYFEGDGCYSNYESLLITTSPSLAGQLFILFLKMNDMPRLSKRNPSKSKKIEGKHSQYSISVHSNFFCDTIKGKNIKCKRVHNHIAENDDFYCLPVVSIEEKSYKGKVYNLKVEEDNSYFTAGGIIHNCFGEMLKSVMEPEEWDGYCIFFDLFASKFNLLPDLTIIIDEAPEVCLQRIKERGREMEKGITIEYLSKLRDKYYENRRKLGKEVVWLSGGIFPDMNERIAKIQEIVKEKMI